MSELTTEEMRSTLESRASTDNELLNLRSATPAEIKARWEDMKNNE